MSNIYVPIDFTNLSEVIPEGDDILYSTICRVEVVGLALKPKRKHKAHVLITDSGYAITNSLRKSNLELNFYPWSERNFWKKRYFRKKFAILHYRTGTKKNVKYHSIQDLKIRHRSINGEILLVYFVKNCGSKKTQYEFFFIYF